MKAVYMNNVNLSLPIEVQNFLYSLRDIFNPVLPYVIKETETDYIVSSKYTGQYLATYSKFFSK